MKTLFSFLNSNTSFSQVITLLIALVFDWEKMSILNQAQTIMHTVLYVSVFLPLIFSIIEKQGRIGMFATISEIFFSVCAISVIILRIYYDTKILEKCTLIICCLLIIYWLVTNIILVIKVFRTTNLEEKNTFNYGELLLDLFCLIALYISIL